MALAKIHTVQGRAVHVAGQDIDTDRIIPARFLRCVTFDGLGENLFRDVRYDAKGNKTGHPLDDPRFADATILIADQNFGCGSSREHAPQSIAKAGLRAIIAESFAEIFFGNATTLGMPCVSLKPAQRVELVGLIEREPNTEVTIDLERQVVRATGGFEAELSIKQGAREALLAGTWDPIGQLLDDQGGVKRVAAELPYLGF